MQALCFPGMQCWVRRQHADDPFAKMDEIGVDHPVVITSRWTSNVPVMIHTGDAYSKTAEVRMAHP